MKVAIGILVIIIGFYTWAMIHDSAAYVRINTYVEKCTKAGGLSTQVQTGFSTYTYQCSKDIE